MYVCVCARRAAHVVLYYAIAWTLCYIALNGPDVPMRVELPAIDVRASVECVYASAQISLIQFLFRGHFCRGCCCCCWVCSSLLSIVCVRMRVCAKLLKSNCWLSSKKCCVHTMISICVFNAHWSVERTIYTRHRLCMPAAGSRFITI